MQPTNHITDLDRAQVALTRLYHAAIRAAERAEEGVALNGEATLGGDLGAASNREEIKDNENHSITV